jgi:hypothetical protein
VRVRVCVCVCVCACACVFCLKAGNTQHAQHLEKAGSHKAVKIPPYSGKYGKLQSVQTIGLQTVLPVMHNTQNYCGSVLCLS